MEVHKAIIIVQRDLSSARNLTRLLRAKLMYRAGRLYRITTMDMRNEKTEIHFDTLIGPVFSLSKSLHSYELIAWKLIDMFLECHIAYNASVDY